MHKVSLVLAGALLAVIVALIGSGIFVMGARGFSARENPSALERWTARRVRRMAAPGDANNLANPIPDSPEVLGVGLSD